MKTVYTLLIFHVLATLLTLNAQTTASNYQMGIKAYSQENYPLAIQLFEKEIDSLGTLNMQSAELEYNLANALFRNGNIPLSILHYERAIKLNPTMLAAKENLAIAKNRIENAITPNGNYYLVAKLNDIQNMLRPNLWTIIAIFGYIGSLGLITLFVLSNSRKSRKIAFYASLPLIVLTLACNWFAYRQRESIINPNTAIITQYASQVKSDPNIHAQELYAWPMGTKVYIIQVVPEWSLVEAENGNRGWIKSSSISRI